MKKVLTIVSVQFQRKKMYYTTKAIQIDRLVFYSKAFTLWHHGRKRGGGGGAVGMEVEMIDPVERHKAIACVLFHKLYI